MGLYARAEVYYGVHYEAGGAILGNHRTRVDRAEVYQRAPTPASESEDEEERDVLKEHAKTEALKAGEGGGTRRGAWGMGMGMGMGMGEEEESTAWPCRCVRALACLHGHV